MNAAKLRGSHALLLPLLVVGAAATVFACAKPEPEAKRAWACESVDVPMGEVVRCTSSALIAESRYGTTTQPVEEATPCDLHPETCGPETTGGAGGTYECNAGDPECPPVGTVGESADPTGGAGGTEGSSGGGTGGTGDTTGDVGTVGGTSSSGGAGGTDTGTSGAGGTDTGTSGAGDTGGTGGNGNGNGNGNGGNGNGNGNGNGGASSGGGPSSGPVGTEGGSGIPDECKYVPELETCGGVGGGAAGGASGGSDCTKNNCDAPGQTKGGASSSSGSSGASSGGASSSSGSSGHGGGRHYKCTKDGKGGATCESTPSCVPGTHPAPCGACVPDGEDGADCVPPAQGGCWVTGGGFIEAPSLTPDAPADGHDNFGGNAKPMKDGSVKGHWNHVDHGTGNHAKGRPEYIYCRHVDEPGPGQPGGKKGFIDNQVYFGGPAEWRSNDVWASGYWFDVVAKDHGEPGSHPHPKNGGMPDTYHFTVRLMDDPTHSVSGAIVYETRGDLSGGNIQMHPPNNGHPATQSALPSWVSLED